MTYKILHGLVLLNSDEFFTINLNHTRSNGMKIYNNTNSSFTQRIINDWIVLPHDIVSAPNVLIFKTKLDKLLYNRRFTYI